MSKLAFTFTLLALAGCGDFQKWLKESEDEPKDLYKTDLVINNLFVETMFNVKQSGDTIVSQRVAANGSDLFKNVLTGSVGDPINLTIETYTMRERRSFTSGLAFDPNKNLNITFDYDMVTLEFRLSANWL